MLSQGKKNVFIPNRPNGGCRRDENAEQIASRVRSRLQELPGVRAGVFTPASLGIRSDGRPVELVLGGPDYLQLQEWRDRILAAIADMPDLVNAADVFSSEKFHSFLDHKML